MVSLVLSSLSAFAHWVLLDEKTQSLLGSVSWSDENSRNLSDALKDKLESLLTDTSITLSQIQKIYVFSGPGAFTGLRMGASFALGLSKALNVRLQGIPSFEIYQKPFWIPIRHQLARNMTLQECLENKIEFLEIFSNSESRLSAPQFQEETLGTVAKANWPSTEEIKNCVFRLGLNSKANETLKIQYGLNPKISGQRQVV